MRWATSSTDTKSWTQCFVLSLLSKIFDPIVLVAPYHRRSIVATKTSKVQRQIIIDIYCWKVPRREIEATKSSKNIIARSYFSWTFENPEIHLLAIVRKKLSVPWDSPSSNNYIALALHGACFLLSKACVANRKLVAVPKMELHAALLTAQLKHDSNRALTVNLIKVFMWTEGTKIFLWLNSTTKRPIFFCKPRLRDLRIH